MEPRRVPYVPKIVRLSEQSPEVQLAMDPKLAFEVMFGFGKRYFVHLKAEALCISSSLTGTRADVETPRMATYRARPKESFRWQS
ncbi:hypothetical protein VTK56DRAFT_9114 [Thermocarpiscus australiensis]